MGVEQYEVTPEFIEVNNKIDDSDKNQMAYALNMKSWRLTLSNSGHGKITRHRDHRDFCGGWVWRQDGKITFSCGSLSKVPEEFQYAVQGAIENELRIFLEEKS